MSRENQAEEVLCASIGLCLGPTHEARIVLNMVREWMVNLASETPRNMDASKKLAIHTLINKLTADVVMLEIAELLFSHLTSVPTANWAVLLPQIITCCGSVKDLPGEYPRQGDSTYDSNMIAWMHNIVQEAYQRTGDARIMEAGTQVLDRWAIALESIDDILERCVQLQEYHKSDLRLDHARELYDNYRAAIQFRGGPLG